MDERIVFLRKEIDRLERQLHTHAPRGFGIDAAFGHRRGGSSGDLRFFLRPDVLFTLPRPNGRMTDSSGSGIPSGWTIRNLPQSDSDRLWFVMNEDDQMALADYQRVASVTGYQYTEHNYSTRGWETYNASNQLGIPADGDVFINPGSDTGEYFITTKHPSTFAPNCDFESIDLEDLASGWSSVSLTGSNAPGCGLNSRQKICNLGNDKCVVMANGGTLYWGDIVSATEIDFTDATSSSNFSFGITSSDHILLNSNGSELLIADPAGSNHFDRYAFEIWSVSGQSLTEEYNSHYIPGRPSTDSGLVEAVLGFVPINEFWCAVVATEDSGSLWVQSLDLISNPS